MIDLNDLPLIHVKAHHSAVARREVLNISYDPDRHGDLKAALDRLAQVQGSRWDGRKRADAAGLLLAEAIRAEFARLSIEYDLTQLSQTDVKM